MFALMFAGRRDQGRDFGILHFNTEVRRAWTMVARHVPC